MIQYTGTKTIKACPMTLGDAEKFLKRKIDASTADNRESIPGYLVEYEDNYRSWSPKDVFEKAYRISETYIDRMLIEYEEAKGRYIDGRKYQYTDAYFDLSTEEWALLNAQLYAMEEYLAKLSELVGYVKAKHNIPGTGTETEQ